MKNTFELDESQKMLRYVLHGDLTSSVVPELQREVAGLFDGGAAAKSWQVLRVDITEATMVDSMGLNFIVAIYKRVQSQGRKMQVAFRNANVHRTLLFTRLDKLVELVKL